MATLRTVLRRLADRSISSESLPPLLQISGLFAQAELSVADRPSSRRGFIRCHFLGSGSCNRIASCIARSSLQL
jgi:hypothetical protein